MTAASTNRKERKNQKRAQKPKLKSADAFIRRSDLAGYVKAADVNKALQQLSSNDEGIGKTLNRNMGEIRTSFQMADGWLHVFRRVLNDMACGRVEMDTDGVCWDWYFLQYAAVEQVAMAVGKLNKEEPASVDKTEEQEAPDDFVFGGDHEQNQAQHQTG
jgi:hypothetical protein